MNSVVTLVNSCLVAGMLFGVFAPDQASAAVCSQDIPRCEKTEYTLDTCDKASLMCGCRYKYMPIPTGCASRPLTPTVKLEPGRINQFVPGATVKLICSTSESGNLTFVWRKDWKLLSNQTGQELLLQGADADKLGKFSCMVNDTDVNLISDESSQQEIVTLDATTVNPIVSVNPQTFAAPGVELDVRCERIPYGANYKFKLYPSGSLVDSVKQNSTQTRVACLLANVTGVTWTQPESLPSSLPSDATDIQSVTIVPVTNIVVRDGAPVTFTCLTVPEEKFLLTTASPITYTFQDNGVTSTSSVGNTYTLTSDVGVNTVRTVSCAAKYGNKAEQTSRTVTVTFSYTYMRTPILMTSQTEVPSGGLLVLTCLGDPTVTYSWLKDGQAIPRQADRIIQYGNFQPSDAGTYVCTTSTGFYNTSSKEVVVRSNAPELRHLASTVTVLLAVICCNLL
ncbi:hypothetical protein BsWGS_07881 [Bradybaena similaris]